jgi:glycosyltransferase involved in cell wall biosynthesis
VTRPTTITDIKTLEDARVVVAHDFCETYGGAERVPAALASLFPNAELWTILGRAEVGRRMGFEGRFRTLLPERPALMRSYRALAPLYPALIASQRLPECDLLITSSYAFVHGLKSVNRAPQLCYCHSPLRFAWSMTEDYAANAPGRKIGALAVRGLATGLRKADRRAAQQVTRYVANSQYVAKQIEANYRRSARVVWPPVDTDLFRPSPGSEQGDYFLFVGRLIEPYKRPSLVIDAFGDLPHRLVVAGDGPEMSSLRRRATPNVEFTGHLADAELIPLMQDAAAVVFPSHDDFGLVPVEAMACGTPVIAFAGGGALETVIPGVTGSLFGSQTSDALKQAITAFDSGAFDRKTIRAHAERWNPNRFREEILAEAASTLRI